jgi:XTP/dITP diphosphohydrolase
MGQPTGSRPRLLIATGNAGKLAEFRQLLQAVSIEILGLADLETSVREIDEHGATYKENAALKACEVARQTKLWALGDDTGLEVDALRGAPGLRTARYAGEQASGADNREKLLAELEAVPIERRTARFVCRLALCDPLGQVQAMAAGHCCGRIALEPRGPIAFGYDSLFEVPEYHRTFAELGSAKSLLSHRSRAVEQMLRKIVDFVGRK